MVSNCSSINDTEQPRRLTNHSIRKHQLQKCVDMGLPPTTTIQMSGHKNIQSVNNYSKVNEKQQKQISLGLMKTNNETVKSLMQKQNLPPETGTVIPILFTRKRVYLQRENISLLQLINASR